MAFQSFSNMILQGIGLSRAEASPGVQRVFVCGPSVPYDFRSRTSIGDDGISIYGWPSRGGMILLNDADHVDIEYLGMDALNPVEQRDDDQQAEDDFCQRLLMLGAKWWDSAERCFDVGAVQFSRQYGGPVYGHGDGSFRRVERPDPTAKESSWVKVGWPSTGGLWVSEFERTWGCVDNEDKIAPEDVDLARYKLARTMDERCHILKECLHAKFYNRLDDYHGHADLKAWSQKTTGEVGPLLSPEQTIEEWCYSNEPPREAGGD